jgi:hypothetical protein
MSILEMLEENSIPEPNSGCWLWLRAVRGNGYPTAWWEGRDWPASHLALSSRGIKVPRGFKALHKCDVPLCVNPDHLFVGTDLDNRRDAKAKGRLLNMKREFCKAGHPLSGDNVRTDLKTGSRYCVNCRRRWNSEGYLRRRARNGHN